MKFKKYQHIERFQTTEVEGIELGTTYIFPKIDGTNASTWLCDDGLIKAGSRNRELTIDNDNAGFFQYVLNNENIYKFHQAFPHFRLFGEWLVPHSLKTYKNDAWRKFYVFDVYSQTNMIDSEGNIVEVPIDYELYQPLLEQYNIDYIPPLKIIKNANYENFLHELNNNIFLIEDGKGAGEGIVIKNYQFKNRYGRTTWAKIVTSEFKEKHIKTMGAPVVENKIIEQDIVDKYITESFVEKEYEKIVNKNDGWNSKFIPQLLQTVFYELIREESWNFVKEFKNPTINFNTLKAITINKVKQIKSNIF
jgi:hypothetical protein